VCINDLAECTCGYDGADFATTYPDWIIVTRATDGIVLLVM